MYFRTVVSAQPVPETRPGSWFHLASGGPSQGIKPALLAASRGRVGCGKILRKATMEAGSREWGERHAVLYAGDESNRCETEDIKL